MPTLKFEGEQEVNRIIGMMANISKYAKFGTPEKIQAQLKKLSEYEAIGSIKEINEAGANMNKILDKLEQYEQIGPVHIIKENMHELKQFRAVGTPDSVKHALIATKKIANDYQAIKEAIEAYGGIKTIHNDQLELKRYRAIDSTPEMVKECVDKVREGGDYRKQINDLGGIESIKNRLNHADQVIEEYQLLKHGVEQIGSIENIKRLQHHYEELAQEHNRMKETYSAYVDFEAESISFGGLENIKTKLKQFDLMAEKLDEVNKDNIELRKLQNEVVRAGGVGSVTEKLEAYVNLQLRHKELLEKLLEWGGQEYEEFIPLAVHYKNNHKCGQKRLWENKDKG